MPTKSNTTPEESSPADPVRSSRIGLTIGLFLILVSMAISGAFIGIGGGLVYRNLEANFWKRVPGVLLDARLVKPAHQSDAPDVADVRYTYAVDGKRYQSTGWSPAGNGMNLAANLERVRKEIPLTVYYNPRNPADSAIYLPSPHLGYLPFTLGLGLFFFFTVAMGGGVLFSALHPELAGRPDSAARRWVGAGIRIGAALMLSSLTGIATLMVHTPGGWWQWALSAVAVGVALKWKRPRELRKITETPQNI